MVLIKHFGTQLFHPFWHYSKYSDDDPVGKKTYQFGSSSYNLCIIMRITYPIVLYDPLLAPVFDLIVLLNHLSIKDYIHAI